MNKRGLLFPAMLLTLAACGGGVDENQDDDVVPAGAIPAAPDARPDAQADAGAPAAIMAADTTDSAAVADPPSPESDTTRVDRIIPR